MSFCHVYRMFIILCHNGDKNSMVAVNQRHTSHSLTANSASIVAILNLWVILLDPVCYKPMIRTCEIDIGNLKTRNSRNWFRNETFIHLFEFKGFLTWGVRDTIFLCWLLLYHQLSTQPTRGTCSAQSRLASPSSEVNLLLLRQELNSLLFHIPGPPPIWDFYFALSEWHILSAYAWTPALKLYLTNPFTKRKVLNLTKLKGKIY